jgi:hypothetical protein
LQLITIEDKNQHSTLIVFVAKSEFFYNENGVIAKNLGYNLINIWVGTLGNCVNG